MKFEPPVPVLADSTTWSTGLSIQADASDITITPQGDVVTEKGSVGKLKIVTFNNPQNLKPVGNNLLESNGVESEKPVDNPRVEQGMLESSNVNPIAEMNKMLQISRMYEATQNMITNDHQRILTMIDKLSQTS